MKKVSEQLKTKAYEIGVMKLLKEVAESGDDVHENHTPLEICDMMLDKVDLVSARSILVLYNIELLFSLRKAKYQGHVTFLTQSSKKAEFAPKIFGGVVVEYIDKEENPLYLMENKWPDKFDIVIANPPYSKKLDLKFLDKAFDIAKEEIVFVHPSTFIIDRKKSMKIYSDLREKFKGFIKEIILFNGNGVFGINLKVPCSIISISKSRKENFLLDNRMSGESQYLDGNKMEDLFFNGYSQRFLSIEKKINPVESIQDKSFELRGSKTLNNPLCFFVETSPIQGNNNNKGGMEAAMRKNDFFVIINKPCLNVNHGRNPKYNIWWEFNTELEAINFLNYCKTDFARFCLSINKMDQNLSGSGMARIPWMDFSQEWTNQKLYAHFNITEEEQAFIKEVIPPYYD